MQHSRVCRDKYWQSPTHSCRCVFHNSENCVTDSSSLLYCLRNSKKGSPYSITERRVPQLIPVLGSQPAGDVSHKAAGRLPLLFARPAVTPETLKRAVTNFAAW